MNGIWVVDDDQSIRWVLERALQREGFAVRTFEKADDCLSALAADQPRVLLSDIRMPGTDGLAMMAQIKERFPQLPVIIMTAYSDLESAVSSFQGGAFEYLAKPFDLDNAMQLVRRAVEQQSEISEPQIPRDDDIGILGQAPAMQELFRSIGRLSSSVATVLITGESGSGKELVARALHQHSQRKDKPFVAINTAAIPTELLESELFGHERGAFTGAQQQRKGRFEQAEGGTLFLDEIGDMPAALQTRLLRVLSDGHFFRVGGADTIASNVRVLAATHQDLEQRVANGQFREDLFHRLNVIRLRLPALRERPDDVKLLADHFLNSSATEQGVAQKQLTDSALNVLRAYQWPGNVRQLENVCHWLTVMAPTRQINPSDLPADVRKLVSADIPASQVSGSATSDVPASPSISMPVDTTNNNWTELLAAHVAGRLADQTDQSGGSKLMHDLTREFESAVLLTTLRATNGRRVDAANRLGVGRNTVTRKIQELDLDA